MPIGNSPSAIKPLYKAQLCYNDILNCPFGIHTDLTDGIASNRIVFLTTELKTVGETATDNNSVNYAGGTDVVAGADIGVVKDGCSPSDEVFMPGFNRDLNVTVTVLGTQILEVAPGETIGIGEIVDSDTDGLAVANGTGTATTIRALTPATGVGTADNPEYVVALIK